ncbi:MAG: restriction endonuclease subunit S [Waddliaceae bacterium]
MLKKSTYPVSWNMIKLGDVADFKNGLNYRAGENKFSYHILSVASFQNNSVIRNLSNLPNVDLGQPLEDGFRLIDRDLVFVRSNGNPDLVGRCVMVFPGDVPTTFSGFTIRARIVKNQIVTSEWVHICLRAGLLKKSLKREGAGTNITNLNQQILSSVLIPIPPLPEQKAIADILSTWDEVIEKTERLIGLKQNCYKKLFRKLILNSDSILLKKRIYKLEELVKKQKGKMVIQNNEFKGRPYIGSISFEGEFITYTESTDGVECNQDDVLMLWDGENAGKVATGLKGVVSSTVCALKLNESINNNYLCLHLKMNESKIRAIREGSGIPHIPGDFLSWYRLLLPSMDMQNKIGQIARKAEKDMKLLKKVLSKLKEQKRGLMQKLLTGKWRVKIKEENNNEQL